MAVTEAFLRQQTVLGITYLNTNPENLQFSNNPLFTVLVNSAMQNGKLHAENSSMAQISLQFGGKLNSATDPDGIPDGETVIETTQLKKSVPAIESLQTYARKVEIGKEDLDTLYMTGDTKVIYNILDQAVKNEQTNMFNTFEYDIEGDGTRNNGLSMLGMQTILNTDITAPLHGVDPAVYPTWHATVYDLDTDPALVQYGTEFTKDNILPLLQFAINNSARNNGGSTDYICVGSDIYNLISASMLDKQQLHNTYETILGFKFLTFMGCRIINLGGIKLDDGTVTISGIPDNTIWGINSSTFHVIYNNPFASTQKKMKDIINEDEKINYVWDADAIPSISYVLPFGNDTTYEKGILFDSETSLKKHAFITAKLNIMCDDRISNWVLYKSGETPDPEEVFATDVPMSTTDTTDMNTEINEKADKTQVGE